MFSVPYLISTESFAMSSKCQCSPTPHLLKLFGIKNQFIWLKSLSFEIPVGFLTEITVVAHDAPSSSKLGLYETCVSECSLAMRWLGCASFIHRKQV